MSIPHTPSVAAYVGMWAWSVVICSLVLGLVVVLDDGDPAGLAFGLVALPFAAVGSLPVAPFGLALLHHLTRSSPSQTTHVALATGIGALCGAGYGALFDGTWGMVPLLAVSVGLARWAVMPHVPAVRQRRRTPVDDDFAGASPRW